MTRLGRGAPRRSGGPRRWRRRRRGAVCRGGEVGAARSSIPSWCREEKRLEVPGAAASSCRAPSARFAAGKNCAWCQRGPHGHGEGKGRKRRRRGPLLPSESSRERGGDSGSPVIFSDSLAARFDEIGEGKERGGQGLYRDASQTNQSPKNRPDLGLFRGGDFGHWRLMKMTSPLASRWVPLVRDRAEKSGGGGLGCWRAGCCCARAR